MNRIIAYLFSSLASKVTVSKKHLKKCKLVVTVYKYTLGIIESTISKKTLSQLKNIEHVSEKEVTIILEKKLLDILNYAYKHTPYYREIFDLYNINTKSVDSLQSIPYLTKEIIRKNKDAMLSRRFFKFCLVKRNTGGSTGIPLEFYSDRPSGYIDNAHHRYLYSLMGYKKGDVVFDCGGVVISEEQRSNNIYWLINDKDSVFGEYCFSALYINDSNVKHYVDKLLEIKPSILRGYPSFWEKLALFILKNNIVLDFIVKGANLSAEICSISQRDNIEKAFSTLVYFEYGHSEMCLYCYTQDNSYVYKSSPLYGYIEVIKSNGEYATKGEIGNVFVTGFSNKGMPFIRYQTGDMAEVLYQNCGFVKLSKILGRMQDYIVSKKGDKIFLTALIFGQHIKSLNNIDCWQIIQSKIGEIEIRIVKGIDYTKEDENEIIRSILSVVDVDIMFVYVRDIPLTSSGKQLFMVQRTGPTGVQTL